MGKLFERVAGILLYTAVLVAVYKLISFEVMIAFGIAIVVIALDDILKK